MNADEAHILLRISAGYMRYPAIKLLKSRRWNSKLRGVNVELVHSVTDFISTRRALGGAHVPPTKVF